jgi:hypothetical protein
MNITLGGWTLAHSLPAGTGPSVLAAAAAGLSGVAARSPCGSGEKECQNVPWVDGSSRPNALDFAASADTHSPQ